MSNTHTHIHPCPNLCLVIGAILSYGCYAARMRKSNYDRNGREGYVGVSPFKCNLVLEQNAYYCFEERSLYTVTSLLEQKREDFAPKWSFVYTGLWHPLEGGRLQRLWSAKQRRIYKGENGANDIKEEILAKIDLASKSR